VWPSRDGMVRLIRRSALVDWTGILHEHAVIRGSTGKLQNYFIHDTHRTLEEMVDKTNEWSGAEAMLRFKSVHPAISWWRMLRVMMSAFWDSYVKQGGWRAGTPGMIESIYQAFSMFVTYAKLWELQQKTHEKPD
jgi:(heptosyl)LPS beta-1,4-glucosyltransferase